MYYYIMYYRFYHGGTTHILDTIDIVDFHILDMIQ